MLCPPLLASGRARVLAVVVAAALAAITLTGCGSSPSKPDVSGLTATQLLAKARTQITAAPYVSISGQVADSGTQTGLNLSYARTDSRGTITLNGSDLQIETVAGKTYFKPSDSFWKSQMGSNASAVIKLIKGRWIVADAGNQSFAQLIQLGSRDFLTKQVLSPSSKVTKGAKTTVNGVECVALKTADGTLYLDASDARPVQIVGNGSSGAGKANFTYTTVTAPTAPSKSDQVDLAALTGAS